MVLKLVICSQLIWMVAFVPYSSCMNLGLISGDLRRTSNPLIIKKNSHHAPITINIKPGTTKLPKSIPRLSNKLSSTNPLVKAKIKSRVKSAILSNKLKRLPKLTRLPLLRLPLLRLPLLPRIPKVPKLPLLPILPILPPKLPLLPILPPRLPKLTKLIKPIRIPLLTKIKLQKALGSELKPVKVPVPRPEGRRHILEKLVKLKKSGSLTTPEFIRFKKLLL